MKPVPVGAPLPPHDEEPQTAIEPSAANAAKATLFEKTLVKPVPVGAPLPPYDGHPQTAIEPSLFSAAKA